MDHHQEVDTEHPHLHHQDIMADMEHRLQEVGDMPGLPVEDVLLS